MVINLPSEPGEGEMIEWIKTSERLPETEEDVLILLDRKYFDIARYWQVCDMDGPEWCYRLRDEFPSSVTHWMPLPKKPED